MGADLVVLPTHEPCGSDGFGLPTGEGMTMTCEARRTFTRDGSDGSGRPRFKAHDTPGCGRAFVLCSHGFRGCPGCGT